MTDITDHDLDDLFERTTDLSKNWSEPWRAEMEDPDYDEAEIVAVDKGTWGRVVVATTTQTGVDEEPDLRLVEYLAELSPIRMLAILGKVAKLQTQVSDLFDAGLEAKRKNIADAEKFAKIDALADELSGYEVNTMPWHVANRIKKLLKESE